MRDSEPTEPIGVVVLTYESDEDLLDRCLRSVVAAWQNDGATDGPAPIVDIVVVDNHSPTRSRETEELSRRLAAETGAPVRFIALEKNFGFAGGINRGIAALVPSVSLAFLLNPDAEVELTTISRCAEALLAAPVSTVSAAPKMLLSSSTANSAATANDPAAATTDVTHRSPEELRVIDAIANAVNAKGEAFNIGLGQPDIGQYDRPEACFGPCFGAALLRRSALQPDRVGPLDETLFMYYEDVEWNWRAQILGFDSVTVPSARVTHVMSASTRDRPYDFKFRLTERNLLIVVILCVPGFDAFRIAGRRMIGLLLGSVKQHYPIPGLRAVGGVVWRLPGLLARRNGLGRRRIRSHGDILAFGADEQTFFDAVRYTPIDREAARTFAEQRLRWREGTST